MSPHSKQYAILIAGIDASDMYMQCTLGLEVRVALGRALVSDPTLLLLDEPFSNLDARLREGMRLELGQLQRTLGLTTIFVTHDQTEAMMLSDRIFVMNAGRVKQTSTPRQVYEQPASRFVMDFLGRINYAAAHAVRLPSGQLTRAQGMTLT